MLDNYVDMQCLYDYVACQLNFMHVNINKSHVNINMLHVGIIYLACRDSSICHGDHASQILL